MIDFIFSLLLRLRIVAYVRNPFLAKIREVSNPMPLELPVTTATLLLLFFLSLKVFSMDGGQPAHIEYCIILNKLSSSFNQE